MDEHTEQQKKHKRYHRFDEEFKREAVRLSQMDGRTVAGTAQSLGIDTNTLSLWRKQFGASVASDGRPPMTDMAKDREIMELRKRLREAEQERDILKKAMGVISRTRE